MTLTYLSLEQSEAKDKDGSLAFHLRFLLEQYIDSSFSDHVARTALLQSLYASPEANTAPDVRDTDIIQEAITEQDQDGQTALNTTPEPRQRELSLTDLPYEIRRLTYQNFFDVNRIIHLTYGPIAGRSLVAPQPRKYRITKDGVNLMLASKQISGEIADLMYCGNTFVLTPGDLNYNKALTPYPHSVSSLWLYGLRASVVKRVKILEIHLSSSIHELSIHNISQGLASFPKLKITIESPRGLAGMAKIRQRRLMKLMVMAVGTVRAAAGVSTVWDDGDDIETAKILSEALFAIS